MTGPHAASGTYPSARHAHDVPDGPQSGTWLAPQQYRPPAYPPQNPDPVAAGTTGSWAQPAEAQPVSRSATTQLDEKAATKAAEKAAAETAALRMPTVGRLLTLSFNQIFATMARRRRDPLSPHVLVYLFADPKPIWDVRTAHRIFFLDDEPDLARLLWASATAIGAELRAGADVRSLTNEPEPMSSAATYLGTAVSTLDTPSGRWREVARTAADERQVPSRCYLWLRDGTVAIVDRVVTEPMPRFDVLTNVSMTHGYGDSRMHLRYQADLAEVSRRQDPDTAVLAGLQQLHLTVLRHGQHRIGEQK